MAALLAGLFGSCAESHLRCPFEATCPLAVAGNHAPSGPSTPIPSWPARLRQQPSPPARRFRAIARTPRRRPPAGLVLLRRRLPFPRTRPWRTVARPRRPTGLHIARPAPKTARATSFSRGSTSSSTAAETEFDLPFITQPRANIVTAPRPAPGRHAARTSCGCLQMVPGNTVSKALTGAGSRDRDRKLAGRILVQVLPDLGYDANHTASCLPTACPSGRRPRAAAVTGLPWLLRRDCARRRREPIGPPGAAPQQDGQGLSPRLRLTAVAPIVMMRP